MRRILLMEFQQGSLASGLCYVPCKATNITADAS